MKKEKSPILVVSCILLLLMFIILPPVFRANIPNDDLVVEKNTQIKLKLLKCNKYFKEELYKVSSSVKYKNDLIDTNTIIYEKVDQVPEGIEDNTTLTVKDEYTMLSSLKNVNITTNNDTIVIKVDKTLIDNNLDNTNLLNYFQPLKEQKNYYESMGYTCNILES